MIAEPRSKPNSERRRINTLLGGWLGHSEAVPQRSVFLGHRFAMPQTPAAMP